MFCDIQIYKFAFDKTSIKQSFTDTCVCYFPFAKVTVYREQGLFVEFSKDSDDAP